MDLKTIPKHRKHILFCKKLAYVDHKTYKNEL